MKGFPFCFLGAVFCTLLLTAPDLAAQESSPQMPRGDAPYLLPQTIFIGDTGRLVVPLGPAFAGLDPFVLDGPLKLPDTPDVSIKRIELEKRGGNSRLLVDFIPYATGAISFPPLDLLSMAPNPAAHKAAGKGPLVLSGLKVHVASILEPSQMNLSEPAPPLAAPGTGVLVYGTIVLILIILSLGIGGSLWGRRHFAELWERFRRRRLLRAMVRFLLRLRQESSREKDGNPGYYLTLLSGEFREFLSLFTGVNCRSLSSVEFLHLPLGYEGAGSSPVPDPAFLSSLFRTWDTLRFSGQGIKMTDMFQALRDTGSFIAALDRAEREKPLLGKPAELQGGNSEHAAAVIGYQLSESGESAGESL